MSVASLTPRVREALSVSSSYDEETIPAAIRRAIGALLRDYNFPKTIKRKEYALTDGLQSVTVPQGFKRPLNIQLYDAASIAWSDPLKRRESFVRPQGDGIPRRYWLEGTKLWLDTAISGGYVDCILQLFYQTQLVADCEDWMTDDFEDVIFNYTIYREAASLRKPEVQQAFTQLWAADRTSLAVYLNELEFGGLEMVMREQTWTDPERYPANNGQPVVVA